MPSDIPEDVIQVPLSRGLFALIDAADEHLLGGKKWSAGGTPPRLYAYRNEWIDGKKVRVYLHRRIAGTPPKMATDHISGETLDCRRANLRICTQRENSLNRRTLRGRSGYRGVGWCERDSRWRAQMVLDRKIVNIGSFAEAREAALAFDVYVRSREDLAFVATNAELGLL